MIFKGGWNGGILPRGVMGVEGPTRVSNNIA
jgi:hypothetical protein